MIGNSKRKIPLTLRNTKERGRGLELGGSTSVPAGTVLFHSLPFAYCLQHKFWSTRCFCCFSIGAPEAKLQRCSRCKIVYYCSSSCQREDWKYHQGECARLIAFEADCGRSRIPEDDITDMVLLGRTLRTIKAREREVEPKRTEAGYEQCIQDHLVSRDEPPLVPSHLLVRSMCVTKTLLKDPVVLEVLKRSDLASNAAYSSRDFYAWLSMFQCNNFAITDERMEGIGAGVYPIGSLVNHSCRPNCIAVYDGKNHVQVCRTLEPLAPGTELLFTYIDTVLPTVERKMILEEVYGFQCKCERCVSGVVVAPNSATLLDDCLRADRWGRKIPQLRHPIVENKRSMDLKAVIESKEFREVEDGGVREPVNLEKLLTWMSAASSARLEDDMSSLSNPSDLMQRHRDSLKVLECVFHPYNLDLYSTRCELFSLALEHSYTSVAAEMGEKMTVFLQAAYYDIPCHPMVGLHYCAMSDVYKEIGNSFRSDEYLRMALECLSVAYGEKHSLTRMLSTTPI